MSASTYSNEFLSEGYLGCLTTLPSLKHRCRIINNEAAKVCCVTSETNRRWLHDRKPNPVVAVKLS